MRPTTRPVSSSELSASFTIIGVTVPSSTEGMKKTSVVSHSTCTIVARGTGIAIESRWAVSGRMSSEDAALSRKRNDSTERPGRRSASFPPSQLPRLMPASTTPMIAVHV